jgi:hypothetical protein
MLLFLGASSRLPLASPVSAQQHEQVCLLVSSSVYEPLKGRLERWIVDVQKTGFQVIEKTINNESASEIRTLLRNIADLAGAFMIGDIPYVVYETTYEQPEGVSHYETFPTDLYYMDLNGEWIDANGNGLFDDHKGNIAPEIWVARLKVSTLIDNEIGLLQNYFDKNHLYRIGALTLPDRALVYTDHYDDYYTNDLTPKTASELTQVYPEVVKVAYPQPTNANDYLERLKQGYNLVRLLVHSGGFGHYFGNQTDGKVYGTDIRTLDPKAFFYVITSCGDFDYRQPDYIGGWYVFSESYGLVAIGDSGVHDLFVVLSDSFFLRLRSEYLGLAYLHYLQDSVRKNARVDSAHNAIMIGDPLLKVAFSGPDTDLDGLSDQYEISIGTNATQPDSDNDRLTDYKELKLGTNPLNPDSDGDGMKDGEDPHQLDPNPEIAYSEAQSLLSKADNLKSRALAKSFVSPEAQDLVKRALAAYDVAASYLDGWQFDASKIYARTAIGLFEEAFQVEQTYTERLEARTAQRQMMTYILIGGIIATVVAGVVYLLRKKARRPN